MLFSLKNMEYMATGTPVLTTNLPGMPEECRQYVYLLEEESIAGFACSLKSVMDSFQAGTGKLGFDAREFVLQNKNNTVQAQNIIKLIRN